MKLATLAVVVILAACGGKSKPAATVEEPPETGDEGDGHGGDEYEGDYDEGDYGEGDYDEGPSEPMVFEPPLRTPRLECDGYIALVRECIACDKVPQESRDATQAGIDAMEQGWGDMSGMPEEAQLATAGACRQATDGLRMGAEAMGCTMGGATP